jgi:translation initiation factor 2 beta subunit (eIF-2beta)/eIF-5
MKCLYCGEDTISMRRFGSDYYQLKCSSCGAHIIVSEDKPECWIE